MWIENRRTNRHPLIADGRMNCVWWMEYTSTGFSPIPASCLQSSPNAGWWTTCSHAWQAKASHEQKFVLPPLLMLPHNTPGMKSLPSHRRLQSTDGHCSATAPPCSRNTFHWALEADLIYSAWLWITQTQKSSLPQCMLHSNSLKTVVNAVAFLELHCMGGVCSSSTSCLSIT